MLGNTSQFLVTWEILTDQRSCYDKLTTQGDNNGLHFTPKVTYIGLLFTHKVTNNGLPLRTQGE